MSKPAILCVDDEPTVLFSLKSELRSHFSNKFIYETASSAEEALETIEFLINESVSIVLIVSDWLMPRMRGDEFLKIVRNNYPHIKCIMLTGHIDQSSLKDVVENKLAEKIISKPWKKFELLNTIEEICLEYKCDD